MHKQLFKQFLNLNVHQLILSYNDSVYHQDLNHLSKFRAYKKGIYDFYSILPDFLNADLESLSNTIQCLIKNENSYVYEYKFLVELLHIVEIYKQESKDVDIHSHKIFPHLSTEDLETIDFNCTNTTLVIKGFYSRAIKLFDFINDNQFKLIKSIYNFDIEELCNNNNGFQSLKVEYFEYENNDDEPKIVLYVYNSKINIYPEDNFRIEIVITDESTSFPLELEELNSHYKAIKSYVDKIRSRQN